MDELVKHLENIVSGRPEPVELAEPDLQILGGYATHTVPAKYWWDGLKRGADAAHPFLVFQYTVGGWGCYSAQGVTHRMVPGTAFSAVIPSEHVYYLPTTSPGWTFLWIHVYHPYIVDRIGRHQMQGGAILHAEPSSALVLRAVDLVAHAYHPTPRDRIAHEQVLFEFMWEHERVMARNRGPQSEVERLRTDVRQYTRSMLPRPVAVPELASRYGMSRSHFSHVFKTVTGLGPAQFVVQIRLEEAVHRLLSTDQSVAEVAGATGFANANHFCRVFRERFRLSPGAFRRQLR